MYMNIYIYVCILCIVYIYIKIGYDCVKIDSNGTRIVSNVHNTQCGIKRNEMKSN